MSATAYKKTAITGGGATAVDGIAVADLLDGDFAFVFSSGALYAYVYDDDSGATESSPDIITPDDVGVGAGRWVLQSMISKLKYDSSLSSDHSYFGETETGVVGETVVFGNLLYWDISEAKWKLADADAIATMGRLALSLGAGNNTDSVLLLIKGYARDDSWNWTADDSKKFIYASVTPGAISETPVSGTGDISQIVGYIVSADKMFFNAGSYAAVA